MNSQDIVFTHASVVCPIGTEMSEFSENLFNDKSGIVSAGKIVDTQFPIQQVALVDRNFYPEIDKFLFADETKITIKHLVDCILPVDSNFRPFDLIIFAGNQGMPRFKEILDFRNQPANIDWEQLHSDFGLEYTFELLKKRGQPDLSPENKIVCVNGCVTSLAAVGIAYRRILSGLNSRALVINIENRVRIEELLRYNAIGALMTADCPVGTASRPFSLSRGGFVKGEGGGAVIIEKSNLAKENGEPILASIIGYAQSCDAWRLTEGREDRLGMIECMERLFKNAKFDKRNIDYINAHGTSTPKNDLLETLAIKDVFKEYAYDIPMSSLKSKIGHLNYACGIVELISCFEMFRKQKISPTINYERDPELDLNSVPNVSQEKKLNFILKNSFGFGGANASLLLGKE